ncbi:hypothetical protein GGS23DRAFT_599950 [Durotheca rogersii]|uniref:uncharacterized protein n=1 Tax=Durotheca rogersii TaxID=419775 RepID=UPI00221E65D8|nr:uncharacterized protein GGS23DRAFT_599950 [Durotheca rogersii]KAI5860024.1 hypothetical protein GGS23DRAFT_599950 [Durotheca rogersii]
MFINPMVPQPVWGDPLPSDNIFASESHLHRGCDKEILQQSEHWRFVDNLPCRLCGIYNDPVSQRRLQRAMDDQQWFQHMAADSGDEAYMADNIYNDYFPGFDTSTPNARAQTVPSGVSAVGDGRNIGPSHRQPNKDPAGNEQMFWPNVPTTNAYGRGFGADFDLRQSSWQVYNAAGGSQAGGYLDFPDSLPGSNWHAPLPVFGEPLECPQVSPSSVSSSDNSTTSDALNAMALDPMAIHSNAAGNSQLDSSAASIVDGPRNAWAPSCPSTISPRMLRIHPSPTPASSTESIHANLLAGGGSDPGSSVFEQPVHGSYAPQRPSHRQRKELPNKPAKTRPAPVAHHDPLPPPKDTGLNYPRQPVFHQHSAHKTSVPQGQGEGQNDMSYELDGFLGHEHSAETAAMDGGRSAKDDFLVKSKMAGMTYREIRRKGNFTEAESTLRGRFRTLTKNKEERVRKPEWLDNDIRLLRKAVRKLSRGDDVASAKIPWKQVADYITEHGGSYHFGYATCHRKWEQLMKEDGGAEFQ